MQLLQLLQLLQAFDLDSCWRSWQVERVQRQAASILYTWLKELSRIAIGTWRRTRACDVQFLAASLAFNTVVSVVPLLAVSLSVFKAYGGAATLMVRIEPYILENFVDASGVHVSQFVASSIQRIESGVLGVGGSIVLFFTSTKLLLSLETAVDRVWQERNNHFRFTRLLVFWVFMFLGPLVMAVFVGFVGSKDLGLIRLIPRHSLAFLFTFVGMFCLNYYVPKRTVSFRSATISGLATAAGIALAQHFYAQITSHLLRYGKIYGSLAAIPIFLLWILVLWWIFFIGVALCATLEERTA